MDGPAGFLVRCVSIALVFLLSGCAAPSGPRLRAVPSDTTGEFTTWWSDTVVKESGTYKAGLRDGHVRAYHDTGALQFEGDFVEGVPEGELEFYDAQGTKERTERWADARLEGLQTRYFKSGQVASTTEYHRGNPEGAHRDYDVEGRLVTEGRWHEGLRTGPWRSYDPSGRLEMETFHFAAGGQDVGFVETRFGTDGGVVQVIMGRRGGVEQGWMTQWHANGEQAFAVAYRDGMQDGPDVSWNAEGVLVREGRLARDKRVGTWTWYDDAGNVTRTASYVDGVEVPAGG